MKIILLTFSVLILSLTSFYWLEKKENRDTARIISHEVDLATDDLRFFHKNKARENYKNAKNLKKQLNDI